MLGGLTKHPQFFCKFPMVYMCQKVDKVIAKTVRLTFLAYPV